MTSTMFYPFEVQLDTDGNWLVQFPDVPEATAVVDTETEVRRQAVVALEAALARYVEGHRPVPIPSLPQHGQDTIAVAPGIATRLLKHNETLVHTIR